MTPVGSYDGLLGPLALLATAGLVVIVLIIRGTRS